MAQLLVRTVARLRRVIYGLPRLPKIRKASLNVRLLARLMRLSLLSRLRTLLRRHEVRRNRVTRLPLRALLSRRRLSRNLRMSVCRLLYRCMWSRTANTRRNLGKRLLITLVTVRRIRWRRMRKVTCRHRYLVTGLVLNETSYRPSRLRPLLVLVALLSFKSKRYDG